MHSDCIFCKIINHEIPAKVIAENDSVLVIQDIAPKAPVHYLIIAKKHVADIRGLASEDKTMAAALLFMAQELSQQLNGTGFRLLVNNGREVSQSVPHLHVHFLTGKQMHDF